MTCKAKEQNSNIIFLYDAWVTKTTLHERLLTLVNICPPKVSNIGAKKSDEIS